MDVMQGCPKTVGIEMAIRTMGPEWIAVDEITGEGDCDALIRTANCGVRLLATAHSASLQEFSQRQVYRPLVTAGIFRSVLILRPDKTWRWERMMT